MPQSTAKLWDALGVERSLGALTAQPIREAGVWGALQAGTTVSTLAPLFPRVEQTA
jgi:methionyl-tRNA synthetase